MKSINALERGLVVLRRLDETRGASLAQLHAATGIPKPTLLRILQTLEHNRYAWRAIADGRYRRSVTLGHRDRPDERATLIAEVAAPLLDQLQRKAIWPSDLCIYRDGALELVETSRRRSNLALAYYDLGFRVDMVVSAPGRAYLAFCPEAERLAIIDLARRNPSPIARSRTVLEHELDQVLDDTRAQGYGGRDPLFGGSHKDITEFDDGLDAIAVPVMRSDQVVACMNMVWPRKYGLRDKIVREHLGDMKATAAAIARALEDASV